MILAWNVRGLKNSGKVKEITSCLLGLNPNIAILIETRVKENEVAKTRSKLKLCGNYFDNYEKHANGRIWVYWNHNKIKVQVVKTTYQMVHCSVSDCNGKLLYWMTTIYA